MDEDDLAGSEEEAMMEDDDIAEDIPVMKRRKLDPDMQQIADAERQVMLTKHFKLTQELGPAFTGGKFTIVQDKFAFAANGTDVALVNIDSGKVVGRITHENEEVVSFAVSPNAKLLGATFKNHFVRIYNLGELHENDWKPESVIQSFKTGNMLGLECCFDPSSRYLAIATSDSQVKVYDAAKGFQTHNFVGHQNIVLIMQFFPAKDSLRLITAGEDLCVKVWDLVINKEVASLRGSLGRITSLVVTKDMKTLIVGNKDGKVAFYNVADNYRQIAVFDATKDMGIPKGDSDLEVNALSFITMAKSQYLAVGTNTGQIALVDLSTQKMCFLEEHFI